MRIVSHARLQAVDSRINHLTQLIDRAIRDATDSLLEADLTEAETVISADVLIDAGEDAIEQEVCALIARQRPDATDARALVAALRICACQQRMGNLAADIAKATRKRHPDMVVPPELIGVTTDLAQQCFRITGLMGTALRDRDTSAADATVGVDADVRRLRREMLTIVTSSALGCSARTAVDATAVSGFFQSFAHEARASRLLGFLPRERPGRTAIGQPSLTFRSLFGTLWFRQRTESAMHEMIWVPARTSDGRRTVECVWVTPLRGEVTAASVAIL